MNYSPGSPGPPLHGARLLGEAGERAAQLVHRDDQRQGLIGFKLRALVDSPSRTRDLGDIRDLLRKPCSR